MVCKHDNKMVYLAIFFIIAYGVAFLLDYSVILRLYTRDYEYNPVKGALFLGLLVARMWLPSMGVLAALHYCGESFGYVKSLVRPPSVKSLLIIALIILGGYSLSLPISYLFGLNVVPCIPGLGAGMVLIVLVAGLLAGISVNAVVALGEEIAWRGFLLDILGRELGFWEAAVLIGLLWGIWHAPLVIKGYDFSVSFLQGCGGGGIGVENLAAFSMFTVSLGLLLAWFRRSTGSVYAASAGHGTVNAVAGLYAALVKGSRLIAPPAGVSVALAFLIATALVIVVNPVKEG